MQMIMATSGASQEDKKPDTGHASDHCPNTETRHRASPGGEQPAERSGLWGNGSDDMDIDWADAPANMLENCNASNCIKAPSSDACTDTSVSQADVISCSSAPPSDVCPNMSQTYNQRSHHPLNEPVVQTTECDGINISSSKYFSSSSLTNLNPSPSTFNKGHQVNEKQKTNDFDENMNFSETINKNVATVRSNTKRIMVNLFESIDATNLISIKNNWSILDSLRMSSPTVNSHEQTIHHPSYAYRQEPPMWTSLALRDFLVQLSQIRCPQPRRLLKYRKGSIVSIHDATKSKEQYQCSEQPLEEMTVTENLLGRDMGFCDIPDLEDRLCEFSESREDTLIDTAFTEYDDINTGVLSDECRDLREDRRDLRNRLPSLPDCSDLLKYCMDEEITDDENELDDIASLEATEVVTSRPTNPVARLLCYGGHQHFLPVRQKDELFTDE
ncbi:uncharacterized protein LOC131936100 [Physella acuta]|uniref:uncharacterized protein LOC131936100 n=1 Tax=Physella acuta TaxID=109671 RepID=UPI0027DCDBAF|nr:uncharacterized protein LOC131936100 [Physella acuta]XP_059148947.1 uncharacterized protein LOC131936100 [Physella acuta]